MMKQIFIQDMVGNHQKNIFKLVSFGVPGVILSIARTLFFPILVGVGTGRNCWATLSSWGIIPGLGSVINNYGWGKSPKDRVVGPLPYVPGSINSHFFPIIGDGKLNPIP